MDQDSLQHFRAEVVARKNLPTIPAVLTSILSLVEDERAGTRKLVEVIERDQTLTAKVLRLANSAFFGQARRVATVPRAILLLGFSTVRNLALGVKVFESLAGDIAKARMDALWEHSLAVGSTVKGLALALRTGEADEGFTAGLLHDVGRLLIVGRFRTLYWDALDGADPTVPVDEVERSHFGVDHAEVGGWLLEAWNLPAVLVEAVRDHHAAAPRSGVPALLAAANRLVHATDLATGEVQAADQLFAQLAPLRITPELWQQVAAGLDRTAER